MPTNDLDKRLLNNREITDRLLDLIEHSQEMTTSDLQGCLDAILLDYKIERIKNEVFINSYFYNDNII